MRHSSLLGSLSLCGALLSFSGHARAEVLECPPAAPTTQDIEAWRQAAATALDTHTVPDAQVSQRVNECFPAQIPQCLKRVKDYSTRFDTAPASQDVTIADSPQKQPPPELLIPDAHGLLYNIPDNIEQIAAEHGWPAVRYKSRHAGGFDSETPSLLMVYVPGDAVVPPVGYDRWLNFAIPADQGADALTPLPQAPIPNDQAYAAELTGGPRLPRIFTMVTVDRRVGTTPANVYFQMFSRTTTGSRVFTPRSSSSVSSCISCHPNGLRAISPLGYHVRADEPQLPEVAWRTVQLINDSMITAAGNRTASWREAVVDPATGATKPLISPKSQGPTVGLATPLNGGISRTQEFIMGGTRDGQTFTGCFQRRTHIDVRDIFGRAPGANNVYDLSAQPNISWEKVAGYMKCATCHNDNTRGAQNRLTDWDQIDFKILVDQSMPLGAHVNPLDQDPPGAVTDDLTPDERIALTNCLQAEYELEQRQLVKWLTLGACQ